MYICTPQKSRVRFWEGWLHTTTHHPRHRHICAYCLSAARQYRIESTTGQLPKTTAAADDFFSISRLCAANKCEILIGTSVTTFIDKQKHICGQNYLCLINFKLHGLLSTDMSVTENKNNVLVSTTMQSLKTTAADDFLSRASMHKKIRKIVILTIR